METLGDIAQFGKGVVDDIKSRVKNEEVAAPLDADEDYFIGRGVSQNPKGFLYAAVKGFPGF